MPQQGARGALANNRAGERVEPKQLPIEGSNPSAELHGLSVHVP
jgi:hypothetical protein